MDKIFLISQVRNDLITSDNIQKIAADLGRGLYNWLFVRL